MFAKTVAALKALEEAAASDLHDLWVPYNPTTGEGGVYWNAAGHSLLENLLAGVSNSRVEFEKRQAAHDAAQPAAAAEEAPEPESTPATAPEVEPTEPTPAPESEPSAPEEVTAGA